MKIHFMIETSYNGNNALIRRERNEALSSEERPVCVLSKRAP